MIDYDTQLMLAIDRIKLYLGTANLCTREQLVELVESHGVQWSDIASRLDDQTRKIIRERFNA